MDSHLSQSFSLQCFVVPQAAVASGSWDQSEWVALRIGLPVWVVNAACTTKGAKAPFFRTLHTTLADRHLVRAAGTGGGPRWRISHSGRAVGLRTTSATRDRSPVGS